MIQCGPSMTSWVNPHPSSQKGMDRLKSKGMDHLNKRVWIDSIKGCGSTQDIIDGPHCNYSFRFSRSTDNDSDDGSCKVFISNSPIGQYVVWNFTYLKILIKIIRVKWVNKWTYKVNVIITINMFENNLHTTTGTPPITRFSYTAEFYLTRFFLGQKPR